MSKLGIKRCNSYKNQEVSDAFNATAAEFDKEKIKGKKIAVYFDFPAPDVAILKETIHFLKTNGASEIAVGASIFTDKLPEEIANFLKEENIQFVDFRKNSYERLDVRRIEEKNPEHFRGFALLSPIQYSNEKQIARMGVRGKRIIKYAFMPTTLTEADYIVPVIKMKDSPTTKIGGVVASTLTLVPTMTRNQVLLNKLIFQFWKALLEMYSLINDNILFGVVDGVDAVISNSEEINKMNVILFSEDPLALDSTTAVLTGHRSREVESNKVGDFMDLGSGLFDHITTYGDTFLTFRKEVKRSLRYPAIRSIRKIIPRITSQQNELIDTVSNFCPTGAIVKEDKNYKIDKRKCTSCFFCVQLAPDLFKINNN
jgi:hypothetical protein